MKNLFVVLFALLSLEAFSQNVTITKVIETGCSSPFVKTVELYVDGTVDFATEVTLNYMQNGDPWADNQIDISALGVQTDAFVYIVRDIPLMENEFPSSTFDASNTVDVGTSTNGDDGYQIVLNGIVVSQFGETETDGTGESWQHNDAVFTRKDGIPDNGTFDITHWDSTATNSTDDFTNCENGAGFDLESWFGTLGSTFPLGSGSGWTPACSTFIGNDSASCDSDGVGANDDTYTATLAFTGANNGNTFTVTSTAGTVGGDDPSVLENGTITVTNVPEGTNITISVSDVGDGGVCDLSRDINSPGCVPLVLNETLFDPPGGLAGDANGDGTRDAIDDEFVELYNNSSSALDISGYILSDSGDVRHVFPDQTIIPPNGVIVVFGGGNPTGSFGGALIQTASTGSIVLNNGGDSIIVENSSNALVIDFNSSDFALDFGDDQSITRSPDVTGNYDLHTNANASLDFSPGVAVDETTLTNTMTWTGVVNTDWNNSGNWDSASVLTNTTALIPDTANQPVIDESDAVQITVLTVENNASVEVNGSLNVDNRINNGGNITFKSTSTNTGQLDEFNGAISGSGDFTTERFIPAGDNNLRAFRFLSSGVTTTTSIRDNWQEGATSNTDDPNPGFGTHITGSTSDGMNGFDGTTSGTVSLLLFDNTTQTWGDIDNTDVNTLETGSAYNLFVRGDRSIDLTSGSQTPTNTTLRATGSLDTGNVDLSADLASGNDEWSLLGNPYQAIVDFNTLTFSGDIRTTFFYEWDANASTNGAYVLKDDSTPAQQMIQPGQSFFVQNSGAVSTAPGLEFTEAAKNTTGMVTSVFDVNQMASADLELYNTNNIKLDVMKFRFEAGADNGIDDFDAGKLENPNENLAADNSGTILALERRDIPQQDEMVELFVDQYQFTQYEFRLNTINWDDNIEVYIVDDYLNTQTLINTSQVYSFDVDSSIPESIATDRFSLMFDNTTLSVNDNVFGEGFRLYPNPTNDGLFSIKTQNLDADNVEIRIHNLMGQQVMKQNYEVQSNGNININAGELSSGIYMLELSQNNQSFTTKLIIQ